MYLYVNNYKGESSIFNIESIWELLMVIELKNV